MKYMPMALVICGAVPLIEVVPKLTTKIKGDYFAPMLDRRSTRRLILLLVAEIMDGEEKKAMNAMMSTCATNWVNLVLAVYNSLLKV